LTPREADATLAVIDPFTWQDTLCPEAPMKTTLTVRYTSGREEKFEVDYWGGARREARLQEFLKSPNVVLQTSTELIIIPATAIESLSIAFPEGGQPVAALEGVRTATRLQ
jgi:hypothetical protein